MSYGYTSVDDAENETSSGNFLLRHWRGQLSLPISWFIVGGLLSSVFAGLIFFGLSSVSASATSLKSLAIAWMTSVLAFVVIRIWALVGIWRSAGRHEARGGSAFWAGLARVALVLGVFGSVSQAGSYGAQAEEYTKLAFGRDPLGNPATLAVESNAVSMKLSGAVTAGTADRFIDLAGSRPSVRLLELDSRGGRIFEAMKIAEYVKAHHMNTNVARECESACTLILLAGHSRTVSPFARVGFHQPAFPGWTDEMRSDAIVQNSQDYVKAGMSQSFVDRMMAATPDNMWFPTYKTLLEEGVITSDEIVVGGHDDALSKAVSDAASVIQASVPRKLDEVTTLTKAEAKGHDLWVTEQLTLNISPDRIAEAKEAIRPGMTSAACKNEPLRRLIEAGGRLIYKMESTKSSHTFDIKIANCA